MTESVPLGILDRSVPSGSHICAFFSASSGRDDIVMPFLAEGMRTGQRCIAVLDSLEPGEVLALLSHHVNLNHSVERGQLEVAAPAEAYLRSGRFCADEMLSYWEKAAAPESSRFSFTRATGEMPSALDNPEGRAAFLRYEARLTEFIADFHEIIVCLYDLRRIGAEVLMDVLRTHPMVIVDGTIHDNPYYIEPGRFLTAETSDDGPVAGP